MISDKVITASYILSYQIRQSAVTTDMMNRSLGKLSDSLKQALDEAKTMQTVQLEQFMKSQTEELKITVQDSEAKGTQELKITVQDSVAKGTQKVLEKLQPQLDEIRMSINTLSQPTKDVSNAAFMLAYCLTICWCDGGIFNKSC